MLYHLLDSDDLRLVPVDMNRIVDDFEFANPFRRVSNVARDTEKILLEIGQKIFKHNYMKSIHGIIMYETRFISDLYVQLQSIIRCCPKSPAGVLLNIDSTRQKTDTEALFEGKWPEVMATLDFIAYCGKNIQYHKPLEENEDDIYENMFR